MTVEESIFIDAGMERVWQTFTELACWEEWNTVLLEVRSQGNRLAGTGDRFTCKVRPFAFGIQFESRVEEIVPQRRVVWRGQRFGITGRHVFEFVQENTGGVRVNSRETFEGPVTAVAGLFFPWKRIREMTASLLEDLKNECESLGPL